MLSLGRLWTILSIFFLNLSTLLAASVYVKAEKMSRDMILCVCFVVLRPSQHLWTLRDGQFTEPHFFLGKHEQAVNQYFVHILSLVN